MIERRIHPPATRIVFVFNLARRCRLKGGFSDELNSTCDKLLRVTIVTAHNQMLDELNISQC